MTTIETTTPRCAHCGDPVTAPYISEWIGGPEAGEPRRWHSDRPACRAASIPPNHAAPSASDTQTARQQRRETLRNLIEHTLAGKTLQPYEASALASCVNGEQADADDLRTALRLAREDSAEGWARLRRSDEQREQAATRLRKARQQRNEARNDAERLGAELAAARTEAEGLRRSLTFAAEAPLNGDVWARLGMALGWTPERAGQEARKRRLHGEKQLAKAADEARALRDEAIARLDEHQLAVSDALGLGTSAPWHAITARARELAESSTEAADLRREQHALRRELAAILHAGRDAAWSALLGTVAARNADWARCREEAEANARTDVAAARQAEQQAGATLTLRHNQLADAVGQPMTTSWPDLINAAFRAYRAADLLAGAERDRQDAEQHRRNLAAILAKPAETPFPELTEYAAQSLTRAGERILDAEQRTERAEAAEQALADRRAEAEQDCRAIAELAQAIRLTREYVGEDVLPAVDGWDWYDALRRHAPHELGEQAEAEHTCPDGEPCPDHDQPAEGFALWVSIRDHAARDTDWWREQISHLTTLDRRGLL